MKIYPLIISSIAISSNILHAQQIRPNVVIFLTDDQGSIDLNRFGAKDLHTPNMDRLCDDGIALTQFYANSSISSPSRASLLTGKYPQKAGMSKLASPIKGVAGMPESEITIAEVLRDAGYATAIVGKWHLGFQHDSILKKQGFDYSLVHMGGCIDNYSHYFYWNGPNRHDLYRNGTEVYYDGKNFSDLMVEESINYIKDNKEKPFFLYFSSNYPHYPLQGDPKWRDFYKDYPSPRDKYAAMVSTIDEKIGKVLNCIEQQGLKENTIIIFMSDNGHSIEERNFFGGGSAGEMRGEKFSAYEGGIRVPAIISFPARFPGKQVRNQIGMGADLMPTILELCNIDLPKVCIDGKSLVKILDNNEKSPHKVIHWQVNNLFAVRKGDYKLVGKIEKENTKIELYNIKNDIREKINIVNDFPLISKDLMNEHTNWINSINADSN